MPTSTSHGRPYIEVERHDELSEGVPASQASAGEERRPDGTLAKGARTVPSLGGKATKGSTKLSHRIDSETLSESYRNRARVFRRATCSELARTVGGGVCGIIPSLFVRHAAIATALSEMALDGGDADRAVKFAEASRMHLMYAREICAKDAASRPRVPVDPLAAYRTPKLSEATS
jgi:hypothetical protein